MHHLPSADPSFAQAIKLNCGWVLHKEPLDDLIAQQTTLDWIFTEDKSSSSDTPTGETFLFSG